MMTLFSELESKKKSICVVGLGYVGLPLAVLLAKKFDVIGFDVSQRRIQELEQGNDVTHEVSSEDLADVSITYTTDPASIADAGFIIVAVPTPIDTNKIPDLSLVRKATETVAAHMSAGAIVVYESTVYPGVTEEVCVPLLEKISGCTYGTDLFVGYSPERVNPGDKEHTIDKIVKVVSGGDAQTAKVVAAVYGTITNTFIAASIKVAEAAKAIENTQRDLNIALMNELAILFSRMDISVYDVLEAANTKWNFLPFTPGLVGGHCIGVDPYYLTYKASEVGHTPEVILAGRGQNDSMHRFVAHEIIKTMVRQGKDVSKATVVVLGATFKENIPDVRNSKNIALFQELQNFGLQVYMADPYVDAEAVMEEYGIQLVALNELPKADTLIVAVAHNQFRQMNTDDLLSYTKGTGSIVIDIKRMFSRAEIEAMDVTYWTL